MNINLAENLFSSNLNFIELNSLSVSYAKERFLQYQEAGVIKPGCSFEDKVWRTKTFLSELLLLQTRIRDCSMV